MCAVCVRVCVFCVRVRVCVYFFGAVSLCIYTAESVVHVFVQQIVDTRVDVTSPGFPCFRRRG